MCDMPGCENEEIYVWVYWKPEWGAPHMYWSRLCISCYNQTKEKVKNNAYFFVGDDMNDM